MKPLPFLLSAVSLLAAFQFSAAALSHPLPRRVNIILIVADGLAANDLSCYGQTQFQTPHLDRLAAAGIRFTNYLAGGLASASARAALMTGKDTSRLPDADFALTSHDRTIAEVLKSSGDNTLRVGEWNLGDENSAGAPWRQGFDEFAGYFDASDAENVYPDYLWKYDQTFDIGEYRSTVFDGTEMLYDNTGGKKGIYVPDTFFDWMGNYEKDNKQDERNHHRPFFITLDETIPGNGNREVPTDAPFSEEPWPQAEKNRAATIARLDDDIGNLLDKLKDLGESSNTVIFFTSDTVPKKGGGVDPKFFQENSGPDDLRVPLIMYGPGTIPAGRVSGARCSASDVLP
ncbi:MAG: sulfatase-like hydrolase/transferase, partial [Limisphaerales bacterium]